MKTDPNYAIELLKELEGFFPNGVMKEKYDDENTDKYNKRFAHLTFLIDEGYIAEIPSDISKNRTTRTYRINSKGIIFLNGFNLHNHLKSP
ncbi:hypothetical protein [Commensalibacter nepenthis]|uniref:Uncharacterized protein n=1 Tax=Commensalibacter nepenthis TaxID=3043872 RepID=A0ABT6Q812_9PROT|nr:hypothetical protein [Commensalibacter sp. TBRC 10068]MDI2113048.1 hypothetical protein [Commensalibacter sp. TBRC 10068]